jgi:anti-sigma regulatory factor (Ser/Thr protein kinase)
MNKISILVTEASQVAEARRYGAGLSQRLGFDDTTAGRVAIVITELATNLVKYGDFGEILLGTFEDETGSGIEIVALDKGPGILDIASCFRDGYSTGGSAGEGLGAVRRQSQAFDIASWPGRGTAILARLQSAAHSKTFSLSGPQTGAVAVPLRGETACGDGFAIGLHESGWTLLVADGLGHGPFAAQASEEAIRLFRKCERDKPAEIIGALHAGLRHTRGAAVSVARYDQRGIVTFAGIGNVAGTIVSGGEVRRMVSLAGTAGHVARRIQEFEYNFPSDGFLIMCTDGIASSWSLDPYPGLITAHPTLIAAVLYRDFARGRDDATVVVVHGDRR